MDENFLSELHTMQSKLIHILHAHPELHQKNVAEKLKEYGLMVTERVGRFGVVGTLKSNHRGEHSIALHANMDALQLTEQTNLPYSSIIPESMHACGHIVMLLGAAKSGAYMCIECIPFGIGFWNKLVQLELKS